MHSEKLVSIIMPAYNAGKYIEESVRSVIAQSYSNWELIIVDDGSTDNTKEVVRKWVETEPRIKYFYQQNGKQGKARNAGLQNTTGSLIAFLDADDMWMPLKLEKQVLLLEETGVDLVFTHIVHIDEKGNKVARGETGHSHEFYHGDKGLAFFFRMNIIPIFTVLAKREAILTVNGFKEEPEIQNIEDYDLWLRMLNKNSRFLLMNEVLGAYRIHNSQTMKGKPSVMKILKMLNEMKIEKEELAREKEKATKLWMLRCLKYDITEEEFRIIISFYPGTATREFFKMLFFIIPQNLLNKIIRYSCKGEYFKNALTYINQKTRVTL